MHEKPKLKLKRQISLNYHYVDENIIKTSDI